MDSGEGARRSRLRPAVVLRAVVAGSWLIALAAVVAGMAVAWLVGWRLEVVQTPSMAPEIPVDALAITRPVAPRNVEVGDVIAFREPTPQRRRILHRVIDVRVNGGDRFFTTQGDANETPDPYTVSDEHVQDELVASVPRLGVAVRLLQPPRSYLVLVGVPLLLAAGAELRRLRRRSTTTDDDRAVVTAPPSVSAPAPAVAVAAAPPDRRGTWIVICAVALGLTLAGQRRTTRRL